MRTSYPFGFGTGISCISYSLHGMQMTNRSISLHCFSSFYMVQVRELTPCRTQLLGLPSSSLGVCRPSYLLVTVGLTGRYELEGVQYGCKFRHSRAWQDQTKMRKEPAEQKTWLLHGRYVHLHKNIGASDLVVLVKGLCARFECHIVCGGNGKDARALYCCHWPVTDPSSVAGTLGRLCLKLTLSHLGLYVPGKCLEQHVAGLIMEA